MADVMGLWLAAWLGCAEPEPVALDRGHFDAYPALVAAVTAADVAGVRREARLLAADPTTEASDGGAAVGAAVGFLLVAEADELGDGLAAVERACAACHAARGVPATGTPGSR